MDAYHPRNHMETYYGQIKSAGDSIVLFEACRLSSLPRVQRRLSEKERQQIRSGSVFVWDEREAGMRRWTDGKSWSASRVSGSFLTYREMEGKRTAGDNLGSPSGGSGAPAVPEDDTSASPDGYRYKPDGLVKQSFSITTTSGQHLHLISYFSRAHPSSANLPSPTTDPQLRHIRPPKGMYPDSTLNDATSMPAVTRSPMADSPFSPENYLRQAPQPPPPFGWPPTPNTPSTMNSAWPGGYFPYGPMMPNGMPFPWAHPAFFAQMQFFQQQQQAQQQQQGSQNQPVPGAPAFDRVPQPLRGATGGPPPPPAPSQPYPQHQPQSQQQPGFGPYIQPVKPTEQIPAYQNSSTWQAQYQAWMQAQQQAQQQSQTAQQPPPQKQDQTTSQQSPRANEPVERTNETNGTATATPQNGHQPQLPSQQQNPPTSTSLRPPYPETSTSSSSTRSRSHSANAPEPSSATTPPKPQTHQSIPGINALIDGGNTHPNTAQSNGLATLKPAPPGADMNALRRLDRAFAP